MKITLRKAAALQENIRKAIQAEDLSTNVRVSIDADVSESRAARNEQLMAAISRVMSFEDILAEIRDKVGAANATAGINGILASQALLGRKIKILEDIAHAKPSEESRVLNRRAERRKAPGVSESGILGRSSGPVEYMEVDLLEKGEIESFKKDLRKLALEKEKLSGKLLAINVNTEIELSAEAVKMLQNEGLL